MNKTFLYTLVGGAAGVGLAYLYLNMNKDKALDLYKTLLIGGVSGAGLGLIGGLASSRINLIRKEEEQLTEEKVLEAAKSLGIDEEVQVKSYISLLNSISASKEQKQRVLKVIDAMLKAKKDNKWDEKSPLSKKKEILASYNISQADFDVFQQIITNNITNLITSVLQQS